MARLKYTDALVVALMVGLFAIVLRVCMAGSSAGTDGPANTTTERVLIDDFSKTDSNSALGTKWELITDQVMGGRSSGRLAIKTLPDRSAMHMTGSVSIENNGGFIQARLMLDPKGKTFDGSALKGIRIHVKGNGHPYAVHLRTTDTLLPWQFYQADFNTDGSWQTIDLPFKSFTGESLKKTLNPGALKSIAVVAIKQQFTADILVDSIRFYREPTMTRQLSPQEQHVIINKGTEPPFSGKYNDHFEKGTYVCRRCGAEIFDSSAKFKSECGWPSFDEQIPGTVRAIPDADGVRTEIVCADCGGHLGHVFRGEALTAKNTRYCVNSISMDFVPEPRTQRAIFAGGCFWGMEYHFKNARGVVSTTVGYTGGTRDNPTYKQVCSDKTGHAEAIEVTFDPKKTSFEDLVKLFFEIHDFTELNRQGPDVGTQYRSAVFYLDDEQKKIAEGVIAILRQKGYEVKTEITPAGQFWPAEDYHRDYYQKTGKSPYCHIYRKIF